MPAHPATVRRRPFIQGILAVLLPKIDPLSCSPSAGDRGGEGVSLVTFLVNQADTTLFRPDRSIDVVHITQYHSDNLSGHMGIFIIGHRKHGSSLFQ